MDLFENTVLCKNCGKKMKPISLIKEGFKIRALKCPSCSNHILHPADIEEYNRLKQLRGKQFHVKLRLVGNSYTVSIPKEIIDFRREIEEEMNSMRSKMADKMKEMVTLMMEDINKISLSFNNVKECDKPKQPSIKVIRLKKEVE